MVNWHIMNWICIFIVFFVTTSLAQTDRTGWLFFKRYTDGGNTAVEWPDTTLSDTNLDKYAWGLDYMLNLTGVFRSSLLEEWGNAGFKQLSFVLFNAVGIEIRRFDFNVENTDAQIDTFVDHLFDVPNAIVHPDTNYSIPLTIALDGEEDKFIFSIINVTNSGLSQEYFILSMDNSVFSNITEAALEDCYRTTDKGTWIPVDDVHQCMYFCMAAGQYDFMQLYSTEENNEITTRCECLDHLPTTISTECHYHCHPSGRPCGQLIILSSPPTVIGASVYKISGSRQAVFDIAATSQVSSWISTQFVPADDPVYSISFGEIRYVRRLFVEGGTAFHYTLAMTTADCQSINFIPNTYIFHGENIGDPTVFESDKDIELSPFPASCLLINITDGLLTSSYDLRVQYVQGDFIMADYFGIYGTWANKECSFTDGMANKDIISISEIDVSYEDSLTFDEAGGHFIFPMSSVGHLDVKLPSSTSFGDDFWISSVNILSSDNVTVRGRAQTSRKCTDQVTGDQANATFDVSEVIMNPTVIANFTFDAASVINGTDMFCGERLHFEIQTDTFSSTSLNENIFVDISINGCILSKGSTTASTCSPIDFLTIGGLGLASNITTSIRPIPTRANPALRPGNTGLTLFAKYNPTISIHLSDEFETEVQRVIIKSDGQVQSARFEFGVDVETVSADTGTHDITFTPSYGRGHEIRINSFVVGTSTTMFTINIQVSMCTNYYGYYFQSSGALTTTEWTSGVTQTTDEQTETPTNTATNPVTTAPQTSIQSGQYTSILPTLPTETTAAQPITTVGQPLNTTTTVVPTSNATIVTTIPAASLQTPGILANNCCCGPNKTYTVEELDAIVQEYIANLTVPKNSLSSFKRKKISASDSRPSATYVGTTCGVVFVTLSGAIFVILDFEFIKGAFDIAIRMIRRI